MNLLFLIHGWSADFDTFREMNIAKLSTWVNKLYKKKIVFILFQNPICTFSGAEWPLYRDCYVLFLNNIIVHKWK